MTFISTLRYMLSWLNKPNLLSYNTIDELGSHGNYNHNAKRINTKIIMILGGSTAYGLGSRFVDPAFIKIFLLLRLFWNP